jgi:hypothetical protein
MNMLPLLLGSKKKKSNKLTWNRERKCFQQTTRRYIPADRTLYSHWHENFFPTRTILCLFVYINENVWQPQKTKAEMRIGERRGQRNRPPRTRWTSWREASIVWLSSRRRGKPNTTPEEPPLASPLRRTPPWWRRMPTQASRLNNNKDNQSYERCRG